MCTQRNKTYVCVGRTPAFCALNKWLPLPGQQGPLLSLHFKNCQSKHYWESKTAQQIPSFHFTRKKDFYSHSFFQQRGPQPSSPPEHAGHACHHWGLPGSRRASLEPTEAEAPALTGQPFGQPQDGPCAALASKPEWVQATRP